MHHKRKRPKNRRSGCLMCKRHKCNGTSAAVKYPLFTALLKAKLTDTD